MHHNPTVIEAGTRKRRKHQREPSLGRRYADRARRIQRRRRGPRSRERRSLLELRKDAIDAAATEVGETAVERESQQAGEGSDSAAGAHDLLTVLLIGGSSKRRGLVRLMLRVLGFTVEEATCQLDAVARLRDEDSKFGAAVIVGPVRDTSVAELFVVLTRSFPQLHVVSGE